MSRSQVERCKMYRCSIAYVCSLLLWILSLVFRCMLRMHRSSICQSAWWCILVLLQDMPSLQMMIAQSVCQYPCLWNLGYQGQLYLLLLWDLLGFLWRISLRISCHRNMLILPSLLWSQGMSEGEGWWISNVMWGWGCLRLNLHIVTVSFLISDFWSPKSMDTLSACKRYLLSWGITRLPIRNTMSLTLIGPVLRSSMLPTCEYSQLLQAKNRAPQTRFALAFCRGVRACSNKCRKMMAGRAFSCTVVGSSLLYPLVCLSMLIWVSFLLCPLPVTTDIQTKSCRSCLESCYLPCRPTRNTWTCWYYLEITTPQQILWRISQSYNTEYVV